MICKKGVEECAGIECEHFEDKGQGCYDYGGEDDLEDEVEEEMIKEDPSDTEKGYIEDEYLVEEDDYEVKKHDDNDLYNPPIITPS